MKAELTRAIRLGVECGMYDGDPKHEEPKSDSNIFSEYAIDPRRYEGLTKLAYGVTRAAVGVMVRASSYNISQTLVR